MTLPSRSIRLAAVVLVVMCAFAARPAPAAAFNPLKPICTVVGMFSGLLGKGCSAVANGGRIITAAKDLFTGHVGSAVKDILGQAGSSLRAHAGTIVGLAAIGLWVIGGAKFALHELAQFLGESTTPRLGTSWFSAIYWRVAGIAALLTLPFLFAAAVQALARSDLALLLRSVLGYLPLAVLMVGVAAPLTMLLLSASDELSSLVSSASGQTGGHAFGVGSALFGSLSAFSGSLFFACFFGLLMVFGATALWIELVMREAAVYVVVLMLPLTFAALVWPARRTWAIRAVELLVALILSKFAIVAVLSLGGAAMDQLGHSVSTPIVGLVLVLMGVFSPWALLRLMPLAELASATVGSLRGEVQGAAGGGTQLAYTLGLSASDWARAATQSMSREVDPALLPGPGGDDWIDGPAAEGPPDDSGPPGPGAGGALEPLGADGDTENDRGAGDTTAPDGALPAPGGVPASPASLALADGSPDGPMPPPGGPASRSAAPGGREPRIPGLPEMYQADNFAWKPLVLGPQDGPPRLWPPDPPAHAPAGGERPIEHEGRLLAPGHDVLARPVESDGQAKPAPPAPPVMEPTPHVELESPSRPALPPPEPPGPAAPPPPATRPAPRPPLPDDTEPRP